MYPNSEITQPFSQRFRSWCLNFTDFLILLLQAFWVVCVAVFRLFVPVSKKSVKNEVVLITGAGHGLGRQLALNFAALGAKVVLWDIDQGNNESVAKEIEAEGGKAWTFTCDVSNEDEVAHVASKVKEEVGNITYLINNAGILAGKPIMHLNSKQIRKTMEVNTFAHFWTIHQFLPSMLEAGQGHIVGISSIAGLLGCSYLTDYCASKYAVVGLMSALREELYAEGKEQCIQLTVACPVLMDTGLVQKARTRFPSVFPIYKVEKAARAITDGVLRNEKMIILPTAVDILNRITRIYPFEVAQLFQRFTDYTIEPHV